MEDRYGCRGIDSGRRERCTAIADVHKSVHGLRIFVILNPGADVQRAAVHDTAFKYAFINNQNLCAAIAKYAPHLTERKLRIERDCNTAGANDAEEPVEAIAVVRAINGNRLSGAQADGMAQESVDPANCRMQVRKIKWPIFADCDLAISLPAPRASG